MTRYVQVCLACNGDQGEFTGKVESISVNIGSCQMDIERTHVGEVKFSQNDDHTIRIHRQTFKYRSMAYWVGNWCWNAYALSYRDYRRLIRTLKANGWQCTSGLARWYDAFDSLPSSTGAEKAA
jgi:hypothetical protein